MRLVRRQRDGQLVLALERIQRFDRIGRDAEDVGPGAAELPFQPGVVDRFLGAAGRIGLGIEIQDQLAAGEIGQRGVAAAIAGQREIRRFLADGERSYRALAWPLCCALSPCFVACFGLSGAPPCVPSFVPCAFLSTLSEGLLYLQNRPAGRGLRSLTGYNPVGCGIVDSEVRIRRAADTCELRDRDTTGTPDRA